MKKIAIMFLSCFLLCGCAPKGLENNLYQVRTVEGKELDNKETNAHRAMTIKENILKLNELQAVAVVVEGNTALIGLRIKDQWDEDTMRLKKQAALLAKEADQDIQDASVTANERITSMIERMEHRRS